MSIDSIPKIRTINHGVLDLSVLLDARYYTRYSSAISPSQTNIVQYGTFNLFTILTSLTQGQSIDYILPQGQYMRFTFNGWNGSTLAVAINFYTSNNELVTGTSLYTDIFATNKFFYLLFGVDVDNNLLYISSFTSWNNSSYVISPMFLDKRSELFQWLGNDYAPIVYNYTPIDYIHNPNKTLKLSMIKAEATNHGEFSGWANNTNAIQRFTDETHINTFLSGAIQDEERILGYTAENNYVSITRNVGDAFTVKYYIDGVHQSSLDLVGSTGFDCWFSLLLDSEHNACISSFICKGSIDGETKYCFNLWETNNNYNSDSNQSLLRTWLGDGWYSGEVDNPYQYGGESGEETGGGSWDNTSDNIDIPTAPSLNISDTDFVTVFNPTLNQVKSLAQYMWSTNFDLTALKKIFANPMDCIIGFSQVPCSPSVDGVSEVMVGNIGTGVTMNKVSDQFVDVDCGSIQIKPYWGNYLDYAPYTKIQLVLPFIGNVNLNTDDVMNKTVAIKYRIDILSGGCIAFITCDGNLLYQFSGSCASQLPLSNLDYKNMISSLISIATTAVGLGSAIASGGITAPMVAVGVGTTANNVMNGKPTIEHGGSLGSTSGLLANRIPYIILTRARQCVPKDVEKYKGFPSLITSKLKNMSGFTSVTTIHLDGVPCSHEELLELDDLLKGGVII